MGRANLCGLCKDLLGSARVTAPFVEPLVKVFCVVRSDVEQRIQEVAEVISEMRDPMQVRKDLVNRVKGVDSLKQRLHGP